MADTPSYAAVVPKSTLWREPVLKVFFMGPEQEKFIYDGAELKSFKVMEIVQEGWNFDDMENGEYVPTFKQVSKASDAHIRVLFKTNPAARDGSWSKLSCQAQRVPMSEPTMVLNLNDCVGDSDIKSTILHEFGHALGFGHEHQHPEYLEVMEKFIDIDSTMDCYGIDKPSFYREQYGKLNYELVKTKYDVHSIMHYPTKIEMLKEQFRKLSKPADVDTDPATKDLSDKEKGMLKNFLLHINYATDKPSEKDKDTIVEAYYEQYQKSEDYAKTAESGGPKTPRETGLNMSNLTFMKWTDAKGKRCTFGLVDEVSTKWNKFGLLLKMPKNVLSGLSTKNLMDAERCWEDVMQFWLDGGSTNEDYPVSWEGLYELLENAKCSEVAKQLKDAVKNSNPQ